MSSSDPGYPRRLDKWLKQSQFGNVGHRAKHLQQHENRLWRPISQLVDGYWRLARLDADQIVLVVESPAWASAARYRQRQILQAVGKETGMRPKQLKIKVAPTRVRPRPVEKRQLSAEAAAHIEQGAQEAAEPRLREALMRLARHGRAKDEE